MNPSFANLGPRLPWYLSIPSDYNWKMVLVQEPLQLQVCWDFQKLSLPTSILRQSMENVLLYFWNVMATLGPGWQRMDSFNLWWTCVNKIRNLSSFWPGEPNFAFCNHIMRCFNIWWLFWSFSKSINMKMCIQIWNPSSTFWVRFGT